MNCVAMPFGGWVLVHDLAGSLKGVGVSTPLFPAASASFGQFHSIVQLPDKLVQWDCKNIAAFNATLRSNYEHEITSSQIELG